MPLLNLTRANVSQQGAFVSTVFATYGILALIEDTLPYSERSALAVVLFVCHNPQSFVQLGSGFCSTKHLDPFCFWPGCAFYQHKREIFGVVPADFDRVVTVEDIHRIIG